MIDKLLLIAKARLVLHNDTLVMILIFMLLFIALVLWPLVRQKVLKARPKVMGTVTQVKYEEENSIVVFTFFFDDIEFEVEEIFHEGTLPKVNSRVTVIVNPKAIFDSTIRPSFSPLGILNTVFILIISLGKILYDIFLKKS